MTGNISTQSTRLHLVYHITKVALGNVVRDIVLPIMIKEAICFERELPIVFSLRYEAACSLPYLSTACEEEKRKREKTWKHRNKKSQLARSVVTCFSELGSLSVIV